MTQADGRGTNELLRVALQIKGDNPLTSSTGQTISSGWYRFKVNPQQYKHSKPQRSTVVKTKSNIIVEDFGMDLATIAFSGTTGFKKDANGRTGEDRLRDLEAFLEVYATQGGDGNVSPNELIFHNFTEGQSFVVHLDKGGFEMERSVDQPILFNYAINLVVLRDASTPSDRETIDPELGNTAPSIGGSSTNKKTVDPNTSTSRASAESSAVNAIKPIIGYE